VSPHTTALAAPDVDLPAARKAEAAQSEACAPGVVRVDPWPIVIPTSLAILAALVAR
jgi:hypothetical protein